MRLISIAIAFWSAVALGDEPRQSAPLEQQLRGEKPENIAQNAISQGDPARGAVLFYQPYLTCTKCHAPGEDLKHTIGPDLARPEKNTTPAYLIESILDPSRVIRKGYESVLIELRSGQTVGGIIAEESADAIVIRDLARDGERVKFSKTEIEELQRPPTSLMPHGLANLLADRQQFLDLSAYVIEISQKGPQRALALKPPAALYALPPLPEYEQHLDHRGIIENLDEQSFSRGEAIYKRVCINCHGMHDHPGSLPTSLKFASGKFKNGSDPYAIYQTLTRGYGMMVAQSWMAPQQKYDVIHYIREAYLKTHNASQFHVIDAAYLKRLPVGDTRGPAPSNLEPWVAMDYGPSLINTYEVGSNGRNFAFKGIAMRLDPGSGGVSRGRDWLVFDHDTLRMAAAWSRPPTSKDPPFIDWHGIHFDGQHQVHPHISGETALANPNGPGWANPATGQFDDPRPTARDGRPFGPLPRAWAHYRGLYAFGHQTIISYTVGETPILELAARTEVPSQEQSVLVFARIMHLGARPRPLTLLVATHPAGDGRLSLPAVSTDSESKQIALLSGEVKIEGKRALTSARIAAAVIQKIPGLKWSVAEGGRLLLSIPAGDQPLDLTLWHTNLPPEADLSAFVAQSRSAFTAPLALEQLTQGGPRRWPEVLTTRPSSTSSASAFEVDTLTSPNDNPWLAQLRFTGHDFFDDQDSLAACTWDGDVWLVRGLKKLNTERLAATDKPRPPTELTWQRIASGLFQPLGLKIINGTIHLTCRDQLAVLHDLNGDGEIDFYENLNNDHQVTEHFHEFAMGLQIDEEGNFYYAKSARHALPALVPHHGTLLRISKDGSRTDILATGFRAANGVCLNPDGSFIVTDQEGHWNPKNRINRVTPGGFYGNMFGYHDRTDPADAAMEQPICWITNRFDRSPAELLWVPSDCWGPLAGSLLNLSYGYGKVYVVPHENVEGTWQGGMSELPLPAFPTGIMRGRFHPTDRQLYVCGMFAWAGNATQPGGLYRIRYTGKPVYSPLKLHAHHGGCDIQFSDVLDRAAAEDVSHFAVTVWGLKRSANYGSEHINEHALSVTGAKLSADGRTLQLEIPDLQPTWGMEIKYSIRGSDGAPVSGSIHNTIHRLAKPTK